MKRKIKKISVCVFIFLVTFFLYDYISNSKYTINPKNLFIVRSKGSIEDYVNLYYGMNIKIHDYDVKYHYGYPGYPEVNYIATLIDYDNLKIWSKVSISHEIKTSVNDNKYGGLSPFGFLEAQELTEFYRSEIENIFDGYNIKLYVFHNSFNLDLKAYYKDLNFDKSLSFFVAVESTEILPELEAELIKYTQANYTGEVRGDPITFCTVYYVDDLDKIKRNEDLFWADFENWYFKQSYDLKYSIEDIGFTEFRDE